MKWLRVAAAALNQTPLDWDGNCANLRTALRQARDAQVHLLCLPELCITGYGCEDAFLAPHTRREAWQVLHDLLPDTAGLIVNFGLPLEHAGGLYNTACLVVDQQIVGFAAKQNLAGDGIHYEPRWFKPWPVGIQATTTAGADTFALGDLLFECGGVRIGFEICEDAWVAHRPGQRLADLGVDILLNPSASHFAFGKHQVRRRFVVDGSRACQVVYLYANLLGNESGRAIFDGDTMIAANGQLLAAGPRFSYGDVQLIHTTVDLDLVRTEKIRSHSYGLRLADTGAPHPAIAFDWEPVPVPPSPAPLDAGRADLNKYEEFTRAVTLGLFDYLRKSRSCGFVVSLSGGADSAAVACLVAQMAELALSELDWPRFQEKLRYDSRIKACHSQPELMRTLLTCVYQATRNSSTTTQQAAATLAHALHATYLELQIDGLVQDYTDQIAQAVGRQLDWERDDIALQNIQARVRGPSVWMLANLTGGLLLATSNRSEAAVGYATMDGDTCGGLSPLAGIDKAFLREWLRWLETTGPHGSTPIPALHAINVQAPTAELRPPQARQTDEDDLMPYDVLDHIERSAVRDKRAPQEVLEQLRADYPAVAPQQLITWIERFFRLWSRNQWKRERFAPSFHLDDESLDPKTWCRFPILSGGYQRELARLRAGIPASPPTNH